MKNFQSILFVLGLIFTPHWSFSLSIENLDEIENALNVHSWNVRPLKQRVKIAVLDKAFYGYQSEFGRSLPSDTQYFTGPVNVPPELKSQHGLVMAQLVTAITGDPELYLYNTYGYSNLKFAIEDLIQKDIDLVLYSEVWEFGGNRDGQGFINALVDKALDQGITWVNAAGNFEQTSYITKIKTLSEDWVQLPNQNNALQIECKTSQRNQKCPIRVVLSWNDFKNDPTQGTDKDLDLALVDDFMNILATSSQKQTQDSNNNQPGYSLYPRETIALEVSSGIYYLRVKNRSHNFHPSRDELMISIDGEGLSMPSHSRGQSVLNPADNPRVITVGALDSDRSSYNTAMNKPNVLTMSSVKTGDQGEFRGSSNAAAFVAGALGLAKSRAPNTNFKKIMQNSTLSGWHHNERGLSLQWLGFSSPDRRCFNVYPNTNSFPQHIIDVVNVGGLIVQTTAGLRVMTPFDPINLTRNLNRYQPNDLILTAPDGYRISPRNNPQIPPNWVEVFQTPMEMGLCQRPPQSQGAIFRLYHFM